MPALFKSPSIWSRINRRSSIAPYVAATAPPPPYTPFPSTAPPVSSPVQAPLSDGKVPVSVGKAPVNAVPPATDSDPFAFLSTFDTVIIVDDSGSMAGSRWREVDACLAQLTPVCTAHDDDGIDLYFFNHRAALPSQPGRGQGPGGYYGLTSAQDVQRLFSRIRPSGGTLTGRRLQSLLDPYLAVLEADGADAVKPLNIVVLTDGEAQDDPESVIVHAARRLDRLNAPPYQLGIQFFQVGNDPDAGAALRELDDALADRASVRDMVDTVTWPKNDPAPKLTPELVLKTLLGAVVRRLDRRS